MKVIAFVGMPGSGKSLAGEFIKEKGIDVLRLGDLTDEKLAARGLERNEANEKIVRESLRAESGMDVYAQRVAEKADALGKAVVVLDGMRSPAEREYLKKKYGEEFVVISIMSSPKTRYERLMNRSERSLTAGECGSRDKAENEKLGHGNTVAMGDYYIVNEGLDKDGFKEELTRLLDPLLDQESFIKGQV